MAIYPNGWTSTLNRSRPIGGAGAAYQTGSRSFGDRHNRFVGEGWSRIFGAAPTSGSYAPAAWVLPRTAGAVASSAGNRTALTVNSVLFVYGINVEGSLACTLTVPDASLSLVVNLEGTATAVLTVPDAQGSASVGISGSTSATLTVDPANLGALAGVFGSITCTANADGTITAIGHLAGDILPYTELSPENLARAVWEALASEYNTAGTMGEKMNDAGSAANPWTEVIEGTYTAAQIMRIMAAAMAGKTSGQPLAPVFRNVTDTADAITATVDASGNRTAVTLNP